VIFTILQKNSDLMMSFYLLASIYDTDCQWPMLGNSVWQSTYVFTGLVFWRTEELSKFSNSLSKPSPKYTKTLLYDYLMK